MRITSNFYLISGLLVCCGLLSAQEPALDELFSTAESIKTRLKNQGDTTRTIRAELTNELKAICQGSVDGGDHKAFIEVLYRSEVLIQDIAESYEYFSILRQSADSWEVEAIQPQSAGEVYIALVRIAVRMSDHPGAQQYLNNIAELPQEVLSADLRAKRYFFSGYLAYYAENYKLAADEAKKAAAISLEGTDIRTRTLAHDAAVACLNEMGQHEEALAHALTAVEIQETFQDSIDLGPARANVYLNLAEAQYGLGRLEEALENIDHSFLLAEEFQHFVLLGNAYCVRGRILRKEGLYKQAKIDVLKSLDFFKQASDLYSTNLARKELIEIAKQAKDYPEALRITEEFHSVRDSLDARKSFISGQVAYLLRQAEQDDAKLAILQEAAARQAAETAKAKSERLAWFGIVSLLLGAVCFVFYRLRSRKQTQQELQLEVERRTAKITEQSRKLKASNEELERFAYIASHDLKTPLRNVTSFLNLIERRLPAEAKASVEEYLAIATANARQMHHLVTDVLEFSRVNADVVAESEKFELHEAIDEMVVQMKPVLQMRKAKVAIDGHLTLTAPKSYVLQIIKNLIENGIKYNESKVPQVSIKLRETMSCVTIQVEDNGIGIDEAYHNRIFQLFKRLHTVDHYEGTGLGLAVCKKVVERLGGCISVDSTPGQGSVFSIQLPVSVKGDVEVQSHVECTALEEALPLAPVEASLN